MKKFISMVMAAAMVVSLVPATAFAATGVVDADRAAKVIDAADCVEDFKTATYSSSLDPVEGLIWGADVPEVSLKLEDAESANGKIKQEIKIKLDGAKFSDADGIKVEDLEDYGVTDAQVKNLLAGLVKFEGKNFPTSDLAGFTLTVDKWTNTSVTYVLEGTAVGDKTVSPVVPSSAEILKAAIDAGKDTLTFDLQSVMNKTNAGAQAKVTLTSDIKGADAEDMVYATVEGKGISAELDDEVVDVAPEEIATIDPIDVEPSVGADFGDVMEAGDRIKLTLSKGFEFDKVAASVAGYTVGNANYTDDDEITIEVATGDAILSAPETVISGLKIEAVDAKAGDECTLTIKFGDNDSVKIVVAKVVDQGLVISVDEDEDVPVMWSGVNAANWGLTADNDEHEALEVTLKETFEGSYSDKDEIEFVLPEGVWVTNVEFGAEDINLPTGGAANVKAAFENAYREGDHKSFIFEKRVFDESTPGAGDAFEVEFTFTLVADPGFVGEVPLTMLVDGEEVGEVIIAKFETPVVVEAQQNDLKIDYRNTEVGSDIVVKEAEAGLWKKGQMAMGFELDRYISFEDDIVYTVNEDESDMEIDGEDDYVFFTVDAESDDEAAVITISNLSLYMDRNLAAGAYDLEMYYNSAVVAFNEQPLFGKDDASATLDFDETDEEWDKTNYSKKDSENFVYDVTDYSNVVKEGFVNIVTAGREQDDASFTTKVVVPVGESYIIAGEATVALDVPAYVSAAGYTMLPVRAVATALGINNNNVLWDQATKTVTILYGQRIITMTVGAKVINVNGSAIPASASVEVVNGRTFLPMRDLATALGVTDITWDAATKTATLNGNI